MPTPLSVDVTVSAPTINLAQTIEIIEGTTCSALRCLGGLKEPYDRTGMEFYDVCCKTTYIVLHFTKDISLQCDNQWTNARFFGDRF